MPVDAQINRDADVPIDALRISDFAHALAQTPGSARIIVLDAARASPYASQGCSRRDLRWSIRNPEPTGRFQCSGQARWLGTNRVHTVFLARRLPARCARAALMSWKCLTRLA